MPKAALLPILRRQPFLQLVSLVTQGGRLPIPPADQLPGPDRLAPAQLDAYVALMRHCWAQNQFDRPAFAEVIVELR